MITIPAWAIVVAVVLVFGFLWLRYESGFCGFVALATLVVSGVVACENSDWNKRQEAERAEQERREAIPHVIREADGCKVYAWKGGDWHYFTRCSPGDTVTTERHYRESCGKNKTCDRKEITVTEPTK